MRSWVKDPEILDDPKDFTYILVNWREMMLIWYRRNSKLKSS